MKKMNTCKICDEKILNNNEKVELRRKGADG